MKKSDHLKWSTWLLQAARGDLKQNADGHFTQYNSSFPNDDYSKYPVLITVERGVGLFLTPQGADFILDNCPPEGNAKGDVRARHLLEQYAASARYAEAVASDAPWR